MATTTTTNGVTNELPTPWRRTPLIHSTHLSKHAGCQIYLKLENLQPSGSFKSRGIGNFLLSHLSSPTLDRSRLHFYTSSGGNAGLACVHAAATLHVAATVVVPLTTSDYMVAKLRAAGAQEVVRFGASWAEADAHLRGEVFESARGRGEEPVYVPPFDGEAIWEGHSTLVGEVWEDLGGVRPDAVVCSVGGGGLFSGIMRGLDKKGEKVRVLAVETKGADSLAMALEKGELVTLEAITSIAYSLGARRVAEQAFEYGKREEVTSVVLKDEEAIEGCVRFADDERIMVEPACGVSVALCYGGRLKKVLPELKEDSTVVIVVCGGSNVTAQMLHEWTVSMEKK
ncbi:serine family amino acid catabolism-related protein [Aaosphaeria arxii CBS 175.79]|uniref:L-serine ammonia-lyase n=1 Tax=Aaosphaeria arxii CBS 175.79 TaxID=1450172 RepID=A0A6A5XN74_9PLEO|nr:serine family amino acid catabolism-related protein [Aaosphaeria arxii CBS 175.79]KAF2014346.1 serine family amino acid catabolism-related protein [Aaosphaeria arxii CBS 175.79]